MLSSLSLRELNYYITFSSLCQVLFENFLSEVFLSYSTALEQPIYYITFSFVCQPFFQNFFSEIFTHLVDSLRAAYILYHFPLGLSSTFSKISFQIFFISFSHLVGQWYYYIIEYCFCQLKLVLQSSSIFVRNNGQTIPFHHIVHLQFKKHQNIIFISEICVQIHFVTLSYLHLTNHFIPW